MGRTSELPLKGAPVTLQGGVALLCFVCFFVKKEDEKAQEDPVVRLAITAHPSPAGGEALSPTQSRHSQLGWQSDWRWAQRDKARHEPGAGLCLGGPQRPASLWVPSCTRVGLVCVRLEVSTEQMLPAWCGLAQPATTSPPLAPDAHGWEGPSLPTCPGCSPKSRPS